MDNDVVREFSGEWRLDLRSEHAKFVMTRIWLSYTKKSIVSLVTTSLVTTLLVTTLLVTTLLVFICHFCMVNNFKR
jgi:hypothetical protein